MSYVILHPLGKARQGKATTNYELLTTKGFPLHLLATILVEIHKVATPRDYAGDDASAGDFPCRATQGGDGSQRRICWRLLHRWRRRIAWHGQARSRASTWKRARQVDEPYPLEPAHQGLEKMHVRKTQK